jgi:hypothetical protein
VSRLWQVFVAPGDDSASLRVPASPWHVGRLVRIPHEHWSLILAFASSTNQALANELCSYSTAPDNNADDEISVTFEHLGAITSFMKQLSNAVRAAPPLVEQATEEIPDEFTNDEHARMIDAVAAVLEEANLLRQPFRAWVE